MFLLKGILYIQLRPISPMSKDRILLFTEARCFVEASVPTHASRQVQLAARQSCTSYCCNPHSKPLCQEANPCARNAGLSPVKTKLFHLFFPQVPRGPSPQRKFRSHRGGKIFHLPPAAGIPSIAWWLVKGQNTPDRRRTRRRKGYFNEEWNYPAVTASQAEKGAPDGSPIGTRWFTSTSARNDCLISSIEITTRGADL